MSAFDPLLLVYAGLLAAATAIFAVFRRRTEKAAVSIRDQAAEAGLVEPPSLHPVIDLGKCLGCGACVAACPEGEILGLVAGKAELIEPTRCIGHGACRTACPFDAISLVFGTERRGIDLPVVGPDFQTNVPGIFIAGELGGMGLISNAVEQGRQAVEFIRRSRRSAAQALDLVIVGSGPAGIAASLAAHEHRLRYLTIEQDSFGGTVAHYPRGKIVMTRPVRLPILGKVRLRETSKEKLLGLWRSVFKRIRLNIHFGERVTAIDRHAHGFSVRTCSDAYSATTVLLAIGRRGTPRKLGVPGEELPKVVYRVVDAEQYRGQSVLVVGGGDSALEAAIAVAQQPETRVILSYRGDAINRARAKNRQEIEALASQGRLRLLLQTEVVAIEPQRVILSTGERHFAVANEAVIVCAGGILPTEFLQSIGIETETKRGTA
ncbi:MAG: NAD(P)-binding domain-containing protein [Hyphomicrobiaceae bacterium]